MVDKWGFPDREDFREAERKRKEERKKMPDTPEEMWKRILELEARVDSLSRTSLTYADLSGR